VDRAAGPAGVGDCRRPGGRRWLGTGEKEEGGGPSTPVLTLVGDGLRRWSRGKGRPAVEVGGGGANGGAVGVERACLARCGAVRGWCLSFYRRRRSVPGKNLSDDLGGDPARWAAAAGP
jgi:hypothetical protein